MKENGNKCEENPDDNTNIRYSNEKNDQPYQMNNSKIKGKFSDEGSLEKQVQIANAIEELNALIHKANNNKKIFVENSRLYCCSCTALCTLLFLVVFYIFDVVKYYEYCKQGLTSSKTLTINDDDQENSVLEYCEAPALSFLTRMIIIATLIAALTISLYCSGKTILLFDPQKNILTINKKKLYFMPSIQFYDIDDLEEAIIESDLSTIDGPKISTFNFYSVTLKFKNENVGLGFGRDCFFLYQKIALVTKINKYINILGTTSKNKDEYLDEKPYINI